MSFWNKKEPEPNEEELTPLELYAEQIAEDVNKAFEAWIRPALAKIVGWPIVNGIKEQDFNSVIEVQGRMLWVKPTHTVLKHGAVFHFKLCQGSKAKHVVLDKFKYEIKFEDLEEKYNAGA